MTSAQAVKIERGGGRPGGYYLEDGTRVPSVTTVLGKAKDPGGLLHWAYKTGLKQGFAHGKRGVTPPTGGLYADKAAEIGTCVHDAAESFIHGFDWEATIADFEGLTDKQKAKAHIAFGAFKKWHDTVRLKVLATEIPLVSETHRIGGTVDAIAEIGIDIAVLDWKSSSALYEDYLIQLATYAKLWSEVRGQPIDSIHVCRFDKETGSFTHHCVADYERYWDAFKHLRSYYELIYEK